MLKNLFDNLHDLELACREYFLGPDTDLASISLAVAAILIPLMNYLDFQYYRWSLSYIGSTIFELAFALLSIRVIYIIRHSRQVKTYERWIFGWSLFTAISIILIIFSQSNRLIENILFSQLLLITIYTLMANRLVYRLIPSITITTASLLSIFISNQAAFAYKYMLTVFVIMVNAGGIVLIAHNNHFKKVIYETQFSESELRRSLETLAVTDVLTGIPNRRSFLDQAQAELARFKRSAKTFSLVMLDLDLLKNVNDRYGHLAGDEALKQFSTCVSSAKRPYDVFGRIAGDEFCLILPETNLDVARSVVSRIREHVHALVVVSSKGEFGLTFSAGITVVQDKDESIDDLLQRVDEALYEAKSKGRDRIELSI
jgi:diguanylate cyclase (GGDEF)-like protein